MASSGYCYKLVGKYADELDNLKGKMQKNLGEMDLDNASVQTEMTDLVKDMTDLCDSLKTTIHSYSFE